MSSNYLKNGSKVGKPNRITISLDLEIEEKLKLMQESLGVYVGEDWSMSKVINVAILTGLLNGDKMNYPEMNKIFNLIQGRKIDLEGYSFVDFVKSMIALKETV